MMTNIVFHNVEFSGTELDCVMASLGVTISSLVEAPEDCGTVEVGGVQYEIAEALAAARSALDALSAAA
jgi:hypothetical protein